MSLSNPNTFAVVEVFSSWQGEGRWTGYPMTFVRLAGCPVNCSFCDTDKKVREHLTASQILTRMVQYRVCITGGEPFACEHLDELLHTLYDTDHLIHLETSGIFPVKPLDILLSWLTISPKVGFLEENFHHANEVKWLYPLWNEDTFSRCEEWPGIHYIQPITDKEGRIPRKTLREAQVLSQRYSMPLSLQVHKLVGWR